MTCCTMRWHDQPAGPDRVASRPSRGPRWAAWEIALMVVGFVVFWPIGLAVLFWILWSKRTGRRVPLWLDRFGARGPGATGNSAFEAWKQGELDRIEQERRRLAEAEQEFAAFLDQLKRARDREEFDRFMARRAHPAGEAPA
jgi:hypothetical protein